MKRICIVLLLSAAIISAAPQQNLTARTGIQGTVIDAVTELPIAGATVAWPPIRTSGLVTGNGIGFTTAREGEKTVSDADGHFTLENIDAGRFLITASKSRYQTSKLTFSGASGQKVREATIRLTPDAVVTGRVLDSSGIPVANASLELIRFGYTAAEYYVSDHPKMTLTGSSGKTDDRGEFRIAGVAPGRYLVRIRPAAESRVGGALYPGVADTSKAVPLDVAAGSETRLANVTLMSRQGGAIRVQIVNDGTTELPSQLTLAWFRIGERFPFSDTSDALPLRISPDSVNEIHPDFWGPYLVQATNAVGPVFRAIQTVEYAGSSVDVSLRVARPDAALKGRITVETSTGVIPYALEGIGSMTLMQDGNPFIFNVRSGKDGTFTNPGMLSNRYWINDIRGVPPNYYIVSAHQGEHDVLKEGAVASNTAGELTVVLSPFAGSVTGSVPGIHDAVVALIPEGDLRDRSDRLHTYPSTRTDQLGGFEIHGVIPGAYRAYAWRQIEDGAFRDPEVIRRFEGKGVPVVVEKRGRTAIDLELADEAR